MDSGSSLLDDEYDDGCKPPTSIDEDGPLDYLDALEAEFPHVNEGAKVLNPGSLKPLPGPPREPDDFRYPEDNGLPALAIRVRDGLLFAVNH
ncbi:OLC1v1038025C1 [Oldenlandia corymbosa var. corymbosa]|uniref:OLC1v1038025C1 n=1 Tax=Oldenlandia corymbosa var. corymbosa TaxID=529605 RepID=A0AAV1CYS4_OLDCO|nr:OLC1v1038025C1 [Oldenlandia corymbosa var. corymbosa]